MVINAVHNIRDTCIRFINEFHMLEEHAKMLNSLKELVMLPIESLINQNTVLIIKSLLLYSILFFFGNCDLLLFYLL